MIWFLYFVCFLVKQGRRTDWNIWPKKVKALYLAFNTELKAPQQLKPVGGGTIVVNLQCSQQLKQVGGGTYHCYEHCKRELLCYLLLS